MNTVTLSDVKVALGIDFADQDAFILSLLNAAISRAKSVTGTFICYNESTQTTEMYNGINDEVKAAIIEDVAVMYASRSAVIGSAHAMSVYRRNMRSIL